MKILMVCAELAPIAKTGGLADAVSGLSRALVRRGVDVRVLLPCYGEAPADATLAGEARPSTGYRYLETAIGSDPAPRVYLMEAPDLFPDDRVYTDDEHDGRRFLRLCDAALSLGNSVGWQPQVFHCHDWQTAPLAVMRHSSPAPAADAAAVVLSLHNIAFQGVFAPDMPTRWGYPTLADAMLPERGDGSIVNFLRAGIRHADAITTVSPTYANEIRTPEHGMGLDDLLRVRADDLHGILNGVDYSVWEPSTDPLIGHNYDARDPAPKRRVKSALASDLGLPVSDAAPIIGVVSRLTWQKGIDLMLDAMEVLLEQSDVCFALLGAGEAPLIERLRALATAAPDRVSFTEGYDERLAHRLLAGSDIVLLPSRYEPCGLTQLYAMRYGTIPVVRATGGLADTVQPFDPETGEGTGSVFGPYESPALIDAVQRALAWYADPTVWRRAMTNAMQRDFSWDAQAPHYEAIYRRL